MTIALAIILHPNDSRVLINQRPADAHLGGLWEFPGGKCLEHESPRDCAVREAWEETGLRVDILDAWPAETYAYPDRTVTLHPFLCRARRENALHGKWVSVGELARYEFPRANAALLTRLQTETF